MRGLSKLAATGMLIVSISCGKAAEQSVPANLEAKRKEYEKILSADPTNFSANFSLSSLYATYYVLYTEIETNSAKATLYRAKALTATQSALAHAPSIDSKIPLAMNLEKLGMTQQALQIYKACLAEADRGEASLPTDIDASPTLQQQFRENRELLIDLARKRVKQLQSAQ
jgi:hypothetical protein